MFNYLNINNYNNIDTNPPADSTCLKHVADLSHFQSVHAHVYMYTINFF